MVVNWHNEARTTPVLPCVNVINVRKVFLLGSWASYQLRDIPSL